MVTLSGWGEKKLDKKVGSWIVHSLSENNNKGRTDNSTFTKKPKLIIPFMEYLENLGNVPSPSQAM